jgi:hypothetical protein
VWFRSATKECGFKYYKYVLLYVDNLLVLSHRPELTMKALESFYRLKDGFAEPDRYLGAKVKNWYFPTDNSKAYWALSSSQYVQVAIKNVESYLAMCEDIHRVNLP